jgi:hypothetical protein
MRMCWWRRNRWRMRTGRWSCNTILARRPGNCLLRVIIFLYNAVVWDHCWYFWLGYLVVLAVDMLSLFHRLL